MPSFTVPGLSSGQNTNDLVRKLVEVESKPIRRWEKENEHNKITIQAWNELKNQTVNLQVKTKALTSFTSPFASKRISANEEGYITGEAGKGAKAQSQEVEILQLATRHKIASNKIKKETEIPAGTFTIVSKDKRAQVEFEGGTLDKLGDKLKRVASQIVRANVTKVDSENSVLSMTALSYGKDASLKFLDPAGVLKAAGLVGDNVPEPPPTVTPISMVTDTAEAYLPEKFLGTKENPKPTTQAAGFSIKQNSAYTFPIEKFLVPALSSLELTMGGAENAKNPDYLGFGIIYDTKDGEKVKYQSVEIQGGKYILPIGNYAKEESVLKIILANTSDAEVFISGISLSVPGEIQGAPVLNDVVSALDAVFKIDGIEITRDTNENIKDAIEGASLTLLKETQNPITLEIIADTSRGIAMIREWVDSYNSLLKYSRDITATSKDNKIDKGNATNENPEIDISSQYWDNKTKSGILAGESVIMRLIMGLKSSIGASYPSSTEPRFKVLSDIGITTGSPGSSWKQIQEGYLTINEAELQTALSEYPESVRELFASDTNEDNRLDDGVGISVLNTLKPYTQFTSGIVSTKVKLSETQMQENNKKIRDYEGHLVNFERKLKQRFEYMEQGMGKNKNVGNYINQSIRQMKANNGD